jgi:hypothetical protein
LLAVKTREGQDAIVGEVQHDQSRGVPRRENFGARTDQSAFRQFVDAVLAFSVDPGAANLERYLAASRSLEESRRPRQTQPQPHRPRGGQLAASSEAV